MDHEEMHSDTSWCIKPQKGALEHEVVHRERRGALGVHWSTEVALKREVVH